MNVLFLFESNLPSSYHSLTLAPGELRVIAALPKIDHLLAIGTKGKAFYDIPRLQTRKTWLEQKITIKLTHPFPYYLRWIPLLIEMAGIFKNQHFDLIHAESPHISGIAAIIFKKIFHVKIAIEYRASYDEILHYRFKFIPYCIKSAVFWELCKWVVSNADLVLANSQTYAKQLAIIYPQANIAYYNPGVNIPLHIGYPKKRKMIGYLGRLFPDKGPLLLLQAVAQISKELLDNNWHIEIAGEGPQKDKLQKFIKQYHLSSLVRLVGTRNRWQFLKKCSILVNPNIILNALEMVNVEAASLKIPVICFGNTKVPETVIDSVTGIKVPNKNIQDLAAAIKRLVNDEEYRIKLGNAAYKHYLNYYCFQKQVKLLKLAYSSIGLSAA